MMDAEFLEMMPQLVQLERHIGLDRYSRPTYGSVEEFRARVEQKARMVRTTDGREVVSSTTTYLFTTEPVGFNDRLTLPDGSTPAILTVEQTPDELGDYYVAVMT